MRVEIVHSSLKTAKLYGAEAMTRILNFAKTYESDADLDILWSRTAYNLVDPNSPVTILVAVTDYGKVTGHLLAEAVSFYGGDAVMIHQLALDKDDQEGRAQAVAEGLRILGERYPGIKRQRIWARNDRVAKIFARIGFVPRDYVLMERTTAEE